MKKALEEDSIAELKAKLRGPVIEPDDPDYDDARKVYNAMIDKKPRLIARCADVADVISSVNFARKHGLLLAIRSGGHNGGGLGICDDGLVIDLGSIKYTRVDPVARTATVGGGCTWGDVDHRIIDFASIIVIRVVRLDHGASQLCLQFCDGIFLKCFLHGRLNKELGERYSSEHNGRALRKRERKSDKESRDTRRRKY